jgi:hypothetical protein
MALQPQQQAMAQRIDALLERAWLQAGVSPAPPATDAEFLRRASLDLTGVIPTVSEVRAFLGSQSADKYERLIDDLLRKPTHAAHFATMWRHIMLPADANVQQFGTAFEAWLRQQFTMDPVTGRSTPYNRLVEQVLLARGNAAQSGPALFYTALGLRPEELAASTSRIFLGVQIQCAQCHDHPFDHWKQRDFWGYAAFFARLRRNANQPIPLQVEDADTGEVTLPDSSEPVPPRWLGGPESPDDTASSRRARLAQWMTAADNPFFARAAVNRLWAVLFGRGLVEPVDDLGAHNPPSHPELLDELAAYFVDSGYDVHGLLRVLASTRAYRLSSRASPETAARPELFAAMAVKTLSAEQLYDCLQEAMRRRETAFATGGMLFADGRGFDQTRQQFLSRFRAPTQKATEFQAGIPQALTLMNGQLIASATDVQQSDLLRALDAPFFSDGECIEVLFLSTVSREPTPEELDACSAYLRERVASGADRKQPLGDILWALLNSAEFVLNH